MATPSYRDRMKAARAQARAQREAEKAAWQRRAELMAEVRRLALDAVKAGIRARGDKPWHYTPAQLQAQANAMIGPWLVAQARARIAARTPNLKAPTGRTLGQSVTTSPNPGEVSQLPGHQPRGAK